MTLLTGYEINAILKKEALVREGIQPLLESGVDVKTINGDSILGPGNIVVSGGGGSSAGAIGATFDGGGLDVTVNAFCDVYVPFAITLTKATLLADAVGSAVVDVWVDTYGNYPPTVVDKITGSAPPTLSTAAKSQDSTLTGWTTTIAAGTTLRFNVNSCSGISKLVITLEGTKS